MDFSTMRSKVDRHAYSSIDDFVADFELIISNCMTFNAKHTLYHKVALRLRRQVCTVPSAYSGGPKGSIPLIVGRGGLVVDWVPCVRKVTGSNPVLAPLYG